jgi:serine/threonine protein kinase
MLAPETILQGRYRILRQLGQGGMGAVYEAIDQRLDTTIALKETLFVEEKLRKQFEREARLLARLHHPALPRVSDHFAEAEGAFLVMQFIGGDDLAEMISRRRGAFPLAGSFVGRSIAGCARLPAHPGAANYSSRYQAAKS